MDWFRKNRSPEPSSDAYSDSDWPMIHVPLPRHKHFFRLFQSQKKSLYFRCRGCPKTWILDRWKWESLLRGEPWLLDHDRLYMQNGGDRRV
jgi:hypothetical protein